MEVIVVFAVLIAIGFFVGGATERRHFANLRRREAETRDFLSTQTKTYLGAPDPAVAPTMVVTEVIIASDYLKTFLAKLRNIFGGEVRSFESLLERARREALLRIVEQARADGYNAVCNVRLDTADIGGNQGKKGAAMAAVLGSATAYRMSRE